jgi:hypothetical protein
MPMNEKTAGQATVSVPDGVSGAGTSTAGAGVAVTTTCSVTITVSTTVSASLPQATAATMAPVNKAGSHHLNFSLPIPELILTPPYGSSWFV